MQRFMVAMLVVLLGIAGNAAAHTEGLSFAPVLKKVTPAVVNIAVSTTQRVPGNPLLEDPFFRRFFNVPEGGVPRERQRQSVGSGVIVDAEQGHVVTNHHVIDGAHEIVVTLQDRRSFRAKLIGSDAGTDIALLQIDNEALSAVPLGDSDDIEVGDFVAAIGNPFGLGQTVTSGIVSALGRSGLIPQGYEDFIQTDASINPGNSGGALIDLQGRLIGINTAIISPAGGNVGIGFAVPVNLMRGIVDQLLEFGDVQRGQLGVVIQDVTPDLAEALDLRAAEGALVSQVSDGSPAADAGLEVGDVVVAIDGNQVLNSADLRNRIGLTRVGTVVELTVVRDGRRLQLGAEIGAAVNRQLAGGEASSQLHGATFRNIGPNHPLYGEVDGVEVSAVQSMSRAARYGLRPGDIVLSINRQPVRSVDELTELLEDSRGALALHIQRGNTRLYVVVQ